VSNERLAFALAVGSPVPYGVPRGALVDVAPVVDGQPQTDRVVFADFIPDNWSAWPNTYQRVAVLERGPQRAVVQATRDWGAVAITTTYTLHALSDRIELRTTLTNHGTVAVENVLSGHTLWPSAGYFFGVPGLGSLKEGPATGALADRAVAYDEDWSIALHAPYFDYVSNRSKDLLQRHSLAPGETRAFDAWIQVGAKGDLAPVTAAEIERKGVAAGIVEGRVETRDGKAVPAPVVVALRQGTPYAWAYGRDGRYELSLPVGRYQLLATGKGHSQSAAIELDVDAGQRARIDFDTLEPPGRVEFAVTQAGREARPLDARIAIVAGQQPSVEFLGRSTFFTELDRPGRLETALAPGRYEFVVTSGGAFLGPPARVQIDVQPSATARVDVPLERLFRPADTGWYAADLHHHADQAEGVTPPADLARSQLAAGLDLLFVSDHDSTANHAPLQEIAARRRVPFIASMELSPSWGHFNAWPLEPGRPLGIDTSKATIHEVLAEARRHGALIVQANHPLIPYGYFASLRVGLVPGGFNPAYDLVEINADVPFDDATLAEVWALWNAGQRYYLAGGTDVHDVWNHESGRLRTFAQLAGPPTPAAYARAVKAGNAYVSYGPLIEPSVAFGSDLQVTAGTPFTLGFTLRAVAGVAEVKLIEAGRVVATKRFEGTPREARTEFTRTTTTRTWLSIEAVDAAGRRAFTNPVWIDAR
jgi:hypothetical protein